jgi:hypothetical protein
MKITMKGGKRGPFEGESERRNKQVVGIGYEKNSRKAKSEHVPL